MTYHDDESVPAIRIGIEGENGDYVKLREGIETSEEAPLIEPCRGFRWRRFLWISFRLIFLLLCFGVLAFVLYKWVGPYLMDKELIPIVNWERETFSPPVLGLLVFASVALFPAVLLPSSPSMWMAGMTFGYGYGFLLIISAAAIGVTIPYFLGHLFLHKIQGWLDRYPKKAAILRASGEGNWFHQFQAVTLIRISPFPYILYNYCAVATRVKYGPYILGSLVGMVPEIFLAIYTGTLIRTLADASTKQYKLSAPQIICNVLGFCTTVVATIVFTAYAKKKLKVMQMEEEPLLQ